MQDRFFRLLLHSALPAIIDSAYSRLLAIPAVPFKKHVDRLFSPISLHTIRTLRCYALSCFAMVIRRENVRYTYFGVMPLWLELGCYLTAWGG
jgi:hypothetical protein